MSCEFSSHFDMIFSLINHKFSDADRTLINCNVKYEIFSVVQIEKLAFGLNETGARLHMDDNICECRTTVLH